MFNRRMKNGRARRVWTGVILALGMTFSMALFQGHTMAADNQLENSLDAAFADGDLPNLHSVLVLHRGVILAERYYDGIDESWGDPLGVVQHSADTLHDLRSVTKSITSLLYGIALGDGLVPGLDAPIMDSFPRYADLAVDPERARITVRHVLTMQMGTDWNEDLPYTDPRNSEIAMEMAADRYRYVLDRPMIHEPGTQWIYNGGSTAIIGHLIEAGTGMSIADYAKEKLFGPLGISDFYWHRGRDGVASPASGLRLKIHDLAKIGTLVLDRGMWNGIQVVPEDWIGTSFTPHAQTDGKLRYGLFWWLAPDGSPPYWGAGFGNGGQRLSFSSRSGMVVVVFAGNYNQRDAWKIPAKIIVDFAVPAVRARD
jgi:CubicO group peptidase (beta-lactamase class C family)